MNIRPILIFLTPCLFISCSTSSETATMTQAAQKTTTPATALKKLQDGNARFVSGRTVHRNLTAQVKDTAKGQYPFATVVSCLDSRTSTELLFDQGIGDVFSARVAGNVVNPDIIGSLEFGSKVAGSKLIAVVGHTACGAIKGACDHVDLSPNLSGLLDRIEPAVKNTSSAGAGRTSKNITFVNNVAENNVRLAMTNIRRNSPILRDMERKGEIAIVGGMYDLETGKVAWLK